MANDSQLLPALRKRFNKCVHPAMYIAYLLDPVSWVANEEESGYVPDLSKVAAMNRLFGIDMVKAAKEVVYRVCGPELRGKVTIEWTVLFAHGLQDMDQGPELTKTKQITGQAIGRMEFETEIKKRRCLWSANGPLGSQYPALAPVARRVMSMHATSCAPERNWSHWGNVYTKKRSSMHLATAEKLIFVGSAAKSPTKI